MDARQTATHRHRFLTWALATFAAAILFLWCCEWDHYRRAVRLATLPVTMYDRVLIGWLLLAKTLCLAAPALLASEALAWFGWRRSAHAMWFGGVVGLLFWLALDLRVQQITGNHLVHYLSFLNDPSAYRWAGDVGALALPAAIGLAAIAGGLVVMHWLTSWFVRRIGTFHDWLGWCAAVGSAVVAMAGVVPAHALVSCTAAVEQVHAALPCDPYAFALRQAQRTDQDVFRLAVHQALDPLVEEIHPRLVKVAAPDGQILPLREPKPHVVVIVLESLRRDALTAGFMPKMAAWAQRGLSCERHY